MYRSKLQELCHKKSWKLPVYSHDKEGPDHSSRFNSSVIVNDVTFRSAAPSSSTKQALNEAARCAYTWFCDPQPSLSSPKADSPVSDSGFLNVGAGSQNKVPQPFQATEISFPNAGTGSQNKVPETFQATEISKSISSTPEVPPSNVPGIEEITESNYREEQSAVFPAMEFVYKSQLTIFTQKKHLGQPTYSHERVGPPHNTRFRSVVTVDGQTFESPGLFCSLKEAEHAAAKSAFSHLSGGEVKEDDIIQYKTHLRGLCLKQGLGMPVYYTNASGVSNNNFVSVVVIDGEKFQGNDGRTKKQAETFAAKVAYNVLSRRAPNDPVAHIDAGECSNNVPQGYETIIKGARNDTVVHTDAGECSNNVLQGSETIRKDCMYVPLPAGPKSPDGLGDLIISTDAGEYSENVVAVKDSEDLSREALDVANMSCDPGESLINVNAINDFGESEPSTPPAVDGEGTITSQSTRKTTLISGRTSYVRYEKVMVFPRGPNFQLPSWVDARHIHPISNDEWIAVIMDSMPVHYDRPRKRGPDWNPRNYNRRDRPN